MASGVTPGLEMIANKDGVELGLLSCDGKIEKFSGTELLSGRLVP